RRSGRLSPHLPQLALVLVHLLWLGIFVEKFVRIPLTSGFDATNHLRYVELLRGTGAVPLPSDGWSTYHPPLYYALVAALQGTLGALGPAWSGIGTKALSFAAGLGQVWLAFALARVLAPARPPVAALAVLFAGCLPLNLYSSAYVSNEPLHAFWFGLAALLTTRALSRGRVRPADAWAVGGALGLALLTKVTALVAAGVAVACLLSHAALLERARPARLLALAAGLAGPPGARSRPRRPPAGSTRAICVSTALPWSATGTSRECAGGRSRASTPPPTTWASANPCACPCWRASTPSPTRSTRASGATAGSQVARRPRGCPSSGAGLGPRSATGSRCR